MKNSFFYCLIVLGLTIKTTSVSAQEQIVEETIIKEQVKESIVFGYVKDSNGKEVPDVEIYVKDSDLAGTYSNGDGSYILNVEPGTYEVVFSSFDYGDQTTNLTIEEGKKYEINLTYQVPTPAEELAAKQEAVEKAKEQGKIVNLDEVIIKKASKKGTEAKALVEQKNAVEIKEIISAQQLSKQGVSEASAAVAKVAGVNKSNASSEVFVRGLGDRYLFTTLNGLPIPSNSTRTKNIDLSLISSSIIEAVAVSKTYDAPFYSDFGGSNIDITTKEYIGEEFTELEIKTGYNFNNSVDFKQTSNNNYFGFYSSPTSKDERVEKVKNSSWNFQDSGLPLNFGISITGSEKFNLLDRKVNLYYSVSNSTDYSYRTGEYRNYRANTLRRQYTDTEQFSTNSNTEALATLLLNFNKHNKLKLTTTVLNQGSDIVFQGGLNGEGYVFDNEPREEFNYLRDQRNVQNLLWITQLNGKNKLSDRLKMDWGIGFNKVKSIEPNTISNELALFDELDGNFQFTNNTQFQTSRNFQDLRDNEVNARVQFDLKDLFTNVDLSLGLNARSKEREFVSQFIGVSGIGNLQSSFLELDNFLSSGIRNGNYSLIDNLEDSYDATQTVGGTFLKASFNPSKLINITLGGRFEANLQDVSWDVANYIDIETSTPRLGSIKKDFNKFFPSLNITLRPSAKSQIRAAYSNTISVPELKELAPFEYTDAQRRLFRGNPNLIFPEISNYDLKYEIFPKKAQLISLSGFYKTINNPINIIQNVSSSGFYNPSNTGEKAKAYGIELESKISLLSDLKNKLMFGLNATRMWTEQDLKKGAQFNNYTTLPLQGASEWIVNSSLSYETKSKNPFISTITANYSSDQIFSLGAKNQGGVTNELFSFTDNTIQRGFVTLDLILEKKFNKDLSLKVTGKNLLNPEIKLTQDSNVLSVNTDGTNLIGDAVLEKNKKGVEISLGIKYKL